MDFRHVAWLSVVALAALIGLPSAVAHDRPAEQLTLLTDTQIAAAFSGMSARPMAISEADGEEHEQIYEIVIVGGGPDIYCPNGVYWRGRDRVGPVSGVYEIRPGQLCTEVGGARQCRYVFKNPAGVVFVSSEPDAARAWSVSLVPLDGGGCG